VVESPKFSPNLTGERNLRLLAGVIAAPPDAVPRALETVGLTGREKDRYKTYSLGMKQRLAIAATLLKDPQLLILDEPTNGLDPAGIREIREMIRGLGEQGVTVLLSSHILAEVQQVCTSATIIGNGRLLASGRVEDLLSGSDAYRVDVPDPGPAQAALAAAGLEATLDDTALLVATDTPGEVTRALAAADIWLTGLTPVRRDLESVFLELTADDRLGRES
jgi:ABC-2 type transport system ATP-binding protein